ncbi:ATP synthase subunit B [Malacoplasma penetrans]|uniref:ATP synthase subunit b n=1 Tax=Malacoplasma penetrans (strain HF-2) TaxID=272633 RepID=ATPF_MALP2|nr:ATP synthase subunit B [Malacoplasma penetrans]Q8EWZ2.1 RecName: Full=ATP synthase subunit b; AltName: Full=ATP synthase F(0) sector subunit b; AltName: Full=ATPase subunit I; AltName: Full=F-type ATPase subunit b; Short=F-ATPase subunit b [Malacoplasma penetrans HF-2]RXY97361.1 ATP synthase subunit B [Malacoplasma penetrans]BAC43848.1 ATP synthase subunit B [Malacoplasma penetrans HF-2]
METINNVFDSVISLQSAIPDNSQIINQIFPNVYVLIAHVISLIFLLLLVIRLAWKPTKSYIEARTKEIQRKMEAAEKAQLESEKNLHISRIKLLESKNTAAEIIENAELDAEKTKKKIEAVALNKASQIESEGYSKIKKQELELEKRKNLEVSKLALETAGIFLSKKIDEEENKKIIDDIVNDLTAKLESSSKEK